VKKEIWTAVAVSIVLVSLAISFCFSTAEADSAESICFIDSGITVYSPLNTTYQTQPSVLKVNLYGAGNFASLDPEVSMSYSIDDVYEGPVHLRSDGEMHFITNAIGTAPLPKLTSGSHCLRIHLYGWNQRSYEPRYLSYVNTVYFSIAGESPFSSPRPNPTPTLIPTLAPTSTPSPEPNSAPELFPKSLAIASFMGLAFVSLGLLVYLKKR